MARSKLTASARRTILAYIRAGGLPVVAAEAAGIDRLSFRRWMRLGRHPRSGPLFRSFYNEVVQARALARLKAEIQAFNNRPIDWLKKDQPRPADLSAGSSLGGKSPIDDSANEEGVDSAPQLEVPMLIERILAILEPYPEIREQMASTLASTLEIEEVDEEETDQEESETPPQK